MSAGQHPDSEFDWLANVYTTQGAINHPSELHGLLLGHLAAGARFDNTEWLGMVLEHMGIEQLDMTRQPGLADDLAGLYEHVDQEIEQDSSAFALLLPDDDYALTERLEALALWVRGFLEGIALSAQEQLAKVDDELQEMLRDLVQISQLDERVSTSEDAEREFFEICEYVRIGVLNLYAEFNAPAKTEDAQPTLH